MSDTKSEIRDDNSTTNLIISGPFNSSPPDEPASLGAYSSTSFTVGAVIEAADSEPQGAHSKPVNADAVRVLDSVLRSRVPDSAILRDTSGEL